MHIDLVIRQHSNPDSYTITCDLAERLVFGRNIVSPVNFAGSEISREHFAIFYRKGEICIEDLSSNGTAVNGSPLSEHEPQKLSAGDVISVPGYDIEVGKRLPVPLPQPPDNVVAARAANLHQRYIEPFTLWEMVVVAAAIASLLLIVYYVAR